MKVALKSALGFNYEEAFRRNLGLVTPEEQAVLRETRVAIPGVGGVGGLHLLTLARMGVGNFNFADGDTFELANLNRQFGATLPTLGKPKASSLQDMAVDINPELRLNVWSENINQSNVKSFLAHCDVVVDGVDAFATEARYLIFRTAREMGIPVITAGPIGFGCALITFTPDSMSFEKYFDYTPQMEKRKQFLKFMVGLTPRPYFLRYLKTSQASLKNQSGPCFANSVALCSGFAATEVLKLVLKRGKVLPSPYYHFIDPYLMKFKTGYLPFGNRGWIQRFIYRLVDRFLLKPQN